MLQITFRLEDLFFEIYLLDSIDDDTHLHWETCSILGALALTNPFSCAGLTQIAVPCLWSRSTFS